jgi:guanine nucleotide-binding protein G(i) subunit alpha
MGCGASAIDSKANEIRSKNDKGVKKEISLLMRGAGESGKSTIAKQMQIIHNDGYSESHRIAYRPIVHSNTIQSMIAILQAMEKLEIKFADPDRSDDQKQLIQSIGAPNEQNLTYGLGEIMSRLWSDTGVQICFLRSREYQLYDSAGYFLKSLRRISDQSYVPTEKDVLMTRIRTTGIVETQFTYKQILFKMYDVGGQRSHRKKWLYCFEDVNAIIFCTAISEYDLMLREDDEVNRMEESMALFDSVCNNRLFAEKSILLFLNKTDLFREKIQISPLNICFPDYNGPNSHIEAISFIKTKFQNLCRQKWQREKY